MRIMVLDLLKLEIHFLPQNIFWQKNYRSFALPGFSWVTKLNSHFLVLGWWGTHSSKGFQLSVPLIPCDKEGEELNCCSRLASQSGMLGNEMGGRASSLVVQWLRLRASNAGSLDLIPGLMATHSSTLAWKIPGVVEPDRLQSMGSRRVGHN